MKKFSFYCVVTGLILALSAPAWADQWVTVRINCSSPMTKNVENVKAKDSQDALKQIEVIMKNNDPYKRSTGCVIQEVKAQ